MKTVELKNYKTFKGHDGMRGINADIHYDGKKIATVYDDARGGCFEYNILGYPDDKKRDENRKLFKQMQEERGLNPQSMELDSFISDLCSKLDQKKDQNKGVLVKSGYGYEIIGFKTSITTTIKKWSDGLEAIQEIYDEQTKNGKEILNKDFLKQQGVKV